MIYYIKLRKQASDAIGSDIRPITYRKALIDYARVQFRVSSDTAQDYAETAMLRYDSIERY